MAVGIKVDMMWYSIGSVDFLFSFFSTICVNLENRRWGSEYPVIMNDFYSAKVKNINLVNLKSELRMIQNEFNKLTPDKVVWDFEDVSKLPSWGNEISRDIKNLADYFVTSNGYNLFEVLFEAIEEGINEKKDIEIKIL